MNVDVLVTTKEGQFIPGLKKENFRVAEDGVPQQVSHFNVSKAPITAVLLVEFASTNYTFMIDALRASYAFANSCKKTTGLRSPITTCSLTSWWTSLRISRRFMER